MSEPPETSKETPLQKLASAVANAAQALREAKGQTVIVASDVDADGLCASYIVSEALARLDCPVVHVPIERPFKPILSRIYDEAKGPVIFVDHGGGSELDIIKESKDRLTVVIDHHGNIPMHEARQLPQSFHCCNGNHWGLHGDKLASASTISYMLLRTLFPAEAPALAHIALLGAAGDGTPWKSKAWPLPQSADAIALDDILALDHDDRNAVHLPEAAERDDQLLVRMPDDYWYSARMLASTLTYLGMVKHLDLPGMTQTLDKGITGTVSVSQEPLAIDDGPKMVLGYLRNGPCAGQVLPDGTPRCATVAERCHAHIKVLFDKIWYEALAGKLPVTYSDKAVYIDTEHECEGLWPKAVGILAKHIAARMGGEQQRFPKEAYVLVGMPLTPCVILDKLVTPYHDQKKFPGDKPLSSSDIRKVSIRCTPGIEDEITKHAAPSVKELCAGCMDCENSHETRGAGIPRSNPAGLPKIITEFYQNTKQRQL